MMLDFNYEQDYGNTGFHQKKEYAINAIITKIIQKINAKFPLSSYNTSFSFFLNIMR